MLESELRGTQSNEISLQYPLTDAIDLSTGWRNTPTTSNPNGTTGSYFTGVRFRKRFKGTTILPLSLFDGKDDEELIIEPPISWSGNET